MGNQQFSGLQQAAEPMTNDISNATETPIHTGESFIRASPTNHQAEDVHLSGLGIPSSVLIEQEEQSVVLTASIMAAGFTCLEIAWQLCNCFRYKDRDNKFRIRRLYNELGFSFRLLLYYSFQVLQKALTAVLGFIAPPSPEYKNQKPETKVVLSTIEGSLMGDGVSSTERILLREN
jgi:hypothetical protein